MKQPTKQEDATGTTDPVSTASGASPGDQHSLWRNNAFAALLILLGLLVAYCNTFNVPFIFDDQSAIVENPSIRSITSALSPPHGDLTASGRPLINFTLAINYALEGLRVRGYHIFNLAIHFFASLTLLGIVRRTLQRPGLCERFGDASLPLAIAMLWSLHPLQTESVTYVIQRAESLMGLFYLLTLYCFIRAAESRSVLWGVLATAASLCGMGTKEVMVTAPLMALLYDRTFLAGTFREALRRRWPLYAGLAGTWLLLGWLLMTSGTMTSGGAGFHTTLEWRPYALTQFWAIAHYLRLSLWPHPLVLDYGGSVFVESAIQLIPCALLVIALLAGTVVGLRRGRPIGFAGAWFFGILALTSSVFPLGDTIFEHRMYLSLAAVIAVVVLAIHFRIGRWSRVVFAVLVVAFVFLTARRNETYGSELALWSDNVAKCPSSARAQNNLGGVLLKLGRVDEALVHIETAIRIGPAYAIYYGNLGHALLSKDRVDEAIAAYRKALEFKLDTFDVHNNLGVALERKGDFAGAAAEYRKAFQLAPDNISVLNNLGVALAKSGNLDEAMQRFGEAMRMAPNDPKAYVNCGDALAANRQNAGALSYYRRAVELNPQDPEVHTSLGRTLSQLGRREEAIAEVKEALRLKADYAPAKELLNELQDQPLK